MLKLIHGLSLLLAALARFKTPLERARALVTLSTGDLPPLDRVALLRLMAAELTYGMTEADKRPVPPRGVVGGPWKRGPWAS